MYDEPPPRPFHTFKFPHIAVEVETTPQVADKISLKITWIIADLNFFVLLQFVALKNEDPQNQLCIKFKTLMTPSKIGRMQVATNLINLT